MTMPTDPLSLTIFILDLVFTGADWFAAAQRLANGLAAKAEKEGRDVTPEEMAIIKGLEAAAVKRRKGGI